MSYSLAAAAQATVMAEQLVLDLREILENLHRDHDSWRDQAPRAADATARSANATAKMVAASGGKLKWRRALGG